jgi:alanine racemase
VTELPEGAVTRGDWVELIGPELSLEEVGRRAGTISYEVLTALGRRYHRHFLGG